MNRLAGVILLLAIALPAYSQNSDQKPKDLRGVLLEQLQTTHNKQDWFVSGKTAMDGLTAEQASWKDKAGNHSVGQLVYHLVFWNRQSLAKFKGEQPSKFSGNNDETFDKFDPKQWTSLVQEFDSVMTDLEKTVEGANDKQLQDWAPTIARIGTHNAYHIGEIVFVRKEQGSWNPEKGVK
jgi:DinB superfamily